MNNEEILHLARDTEIDLYELGQAIQKELLAPGKYGELMSEWYHYVKKDIQRVIEVSEREEIDYD